MSGSVSEDESKSVDVEREYFDFGHIKMDKSQVFATTKVCYASVNIKPVVPGHLMVTTRRKVARVCDLTPEELTDMWALAKEIFKSCRDKIQG
eukprot:TRINITY_DN5227_c0_g1_i1.p1 TRINITY_DN5227_c0_g1~~TRINITY_DN5227_c0_g1_i1.p1  ORF type:complete len:93 (+),score=17.21 TRINITY_DN5227_c0_g1_i1:16-294(+)